MKDQRLVLRLTLLVTFVWSAILVASLLWDIQNAKEQLMEMAYAEARTSLNKDMTFRRWATLHGGVYVPVTDTQKSVPWLAHVTERDVTTTTGKALTLLNPATIMRQVMGLYSKEYGIGGRITGLKYFNPDNAPDEWERKQLESFARGEKTEVTEVIDIEGKPQLRYLRAVFMEPGCDKCHAVLGYKTGDVRGAIGIALPLSPYLERLDATQREETVSHALIWLIGMAGILWSAHFARRWLAALAERSAALVSANRELLAANKQLEGFVYAASHDLKGPLARISNFSTLLERNYRDRLEGDGLMFLDFIRDNSLRLNALIDDLLSHARIDQQASQLHPTDLLSAVQVVLHEKADEIKETATVVRIDLRAVQVLANPYALHQVLHNLLENALKYSAKVAKPVIDIGGEDVEGGFRLWMRDNGIGFDMEYHDKIFEIFRRLHTYAEYAGSGVGLALVKLAMERMGGKVWAKSELGQGATFYLEFQTVT